MSAAFALKLVRAALVDARVRGCVCSPTIGLRGRPPLLDVSISHEQDCPAAAVEAFVFVPRAER